jgi:UTP-glucose-1-phosphate uridylyltransferase
LDRNKHLNKDLFDEFSELETIPNVKGKDQRANVVSNIFLHRIKCVCMRQVKGLSLYNTANIEV